MFQNPRNHAPDMLTRQRDRLQNASLQAEGAIDLISRMVERLHAVNADIQTYLDDSRAYREQLAAVENEMEQNFRHNATVAENFAKLLDS